MTTARDFAPGTLVAGRYEILGVLGRGGSATVYRARQHGADEIVAMKVMHIGMASDPAERERFAREAAVVQQLRHPHIVRLLDYGYTEQGMPYLAFALLVGRSLEERIRLEGELDWIEVGRLSAQVLSALEKAHALEIVHRDIKPANIYLVQSPMGEVARVLDFGLAKVVRSPDDDDNDVEALTRVGSVLGTPRYLSPEQARGETVGQAADIYSFGLVMAEMLCGRPIVEGNTHFDMFVQHGSDAPHVLPPEVLGSPFAAIIRRAVDKEPNVRYRLASQMLADVEAALGKLQDWNDDEREGDDADLVVTQLVRMGKAAAGGQGNEASEQLRRAFNLLAGAPPPDRNPRPAPEAIAPAGPPYHPARSPHELGPDARQPSPILDEETTSSPTTLAKPMRGFEIDEPTTVAPDIRRPAAPLATPAIEEDDEVEAATCVADAAALGLDLGALAPPPAPMPPASPLGAGPPPAPAPPPNTPATAPMPAVAAAAPAPASAVGAPAPAAPAAVQRGEQSPTALIDTSGWPTARPLAEAGGRPGNQPMGSDLGATAFLSAGDPVFYPPQPQKMASEPNRLTQALPPASPPFAPAGPHPGATPTPSPARAAPFATGHSQVQSAWAPRPGPAFFIPMPPEPAPPSRSPAAAVATIVIIVAIAAGAFVWLLSGP